MEKLKKTWQKQDLTNKAILVSGVAVAIVCLCMGRGLYALVFIILTAAFAMSHSTQRYKRLSRLYGALYFHMPDGEIVPESFDQIRVDYLRGGGERYVGRQVSVWFPYWRMDKEGSMDTGFGLEISTKGFDDPDGVLPTLRSGDFIYVTGRIVAPRRDYFYIGEVEEVRRREDRP